VATVPSGARVQAVLTSTLCTAKQQDKEVFTLLVDLLRSAKPKLLDILPTAMMNQPGSQVCSGRSRGSENHPIYSSRFHSYRLLMVWRHNRPRLNRFSTQRKSPLVDQLPR
jgi:hypothetical protein